MGQLKKGGLDHKSAFSKAAEEWKELSSKEKEKYEKMAKED
jgi:hypothetical protein